MLVTLKNFEEIYDLTYKDVLKFIICKCNNLNDVNEILQDTYIEFYQSLVRKKRLNLDNEKSYIIGIAKNVLKKYYRNKFKENSKIENIFKIENEVEVEKQISSNEDIEIEFINRENVEQIWDYLNKKDVLIAKIFYLYYSLDFKIIEIAEELNLNESNVKNYIYRTKKELKEIFGKEEAQNEE